MADGIITLDFAKRHCRDLANDPRLPDWIAGVTQMFEDYTNYHLVAADVTEYLNGTNDIYLILQNRFINSVAGVWVDPTGAYGDGPDAFNSTTLLTVGVDYGIQKDTRNEVGSGILLRLNGVWPGRRVRMAGNLSLEVIEGFGNIMVEYNCGFTPGNIPMDLQLAAISGIRCMERTQQFGVPIQMISFDYMSIKLAGMGGQVVKDLTSMESILGLYTKAVL